MRFWAHFDCMQEIIFYKRAAIGIDQRKLPLDEALARAGENLARERAAFIGPKIPKPTHVESVVRGAIFSNKYEAMREMLKDHPENIQAFSDFENKRGFWANRSFERLEETFTRDRVMSARPSTRQPSWGL